MYYIPTNKQTVKRGDIVQAMDGNHAGEYYEVVRTASAQDKDGFGNPLPYGQVRYTFNLLNVNTGKMRQTELDRQFVTTNDGVKDWQSISLSKLSDHFGITLRHVTKQETIAPEVNKAIAKQDAVTANNFLWGLLHGNSNCAGRSLPNLGNGAQVFVLALPA